MLPDPFSGLRIWFASVLFSDRYVLISEELYDCLRGLWAPLVLLCRADYCPLMISVILGPIRLLPSKSCITIDLWVYFLERILISIGLRLGKYVSSFSWVLWCSLLLTWNLEGSSLLIDLFCCCFYGMESFLLGMSTDAKPSFRTSNFFKYYCSTRRSDWALASIATLPLMVLCCGIGILTLCTKCCFDVLCYWLGT